MRGVQHATAVVNLSAEVLEMKYVGAMKMFRTMYSCTVYLKVSECSSKSEKKVRNGIFDFDFHENAFDFKHCINLSF